METEGRTFTKKGEPMSKFVPRLSRDDAAAQGDMFFVLRNKTRLRIIDLLSRYGGLLCVVEIADVLSENPSVISNHLAILRAVQFVTRETYGSYAYYTLEQGALIRYKLYLEQLISPMGEKSRQEFPETASLSDHSAFS